MPEIQSKEIRFPSSILERFFPFKLPASMAKKEDREHQQSFKLYQRKKKKSLS